MFFIFNLNQKGFQLNGWSTKLRDVRHAGRPAWGDQTPPEMIEVSTNHGETPGPTVKKHRGSYFGS